MYRYVYSYTPLLEGFTLFPLLMEVRIDSPKSSQLSRVNNSACCSSTDRAISSSGPLYGCDIIRVFLSVRMDKKSSMKSRDKATSLSITTLSLIQPCTRHGLNAMSTRRSFGCFFPFSTTCLRTPPFTGITGSFHSFCWGIRLHLQRLT